jgi:hypothetical protein
MDGERLVERDLALQTCIRDVLGSDLGRDTGYSDRSISWFSAAPPDKCRDIMPRPLPSKFFTVHQLPYNSTLFLLATAITRYYPRQCMLVSGRLHAPAVLTLRLETSSVPAG